MNQPKEARQKRNSAKKGVKKTKEKRNRGRKKKKAKIGAAVERNKTTIVRRDDMQV